VPPVPDGQTEDDGSLIEGVTYYVEGIPCVANSRDNAWDLIAVGKKGDRIAIRTRDTSYSFSVSGFDNYYMMNRTTLVMMNADYEVFRVYALATGRLLATIEQALCETGDEYMIFRQANGSYVLDQEGRVRYVSEKTQITPIAADCLLLSRGPYVGIADLNGDWLVKTLAWELTRDAPGLLPYG
jgi:hypothetical protein